MFYINIARRNKYLKEIVGRVEELLCVAAFRVLDFSFFNCFSKTKKVPRLVISLRISCRTNRYLEPNIITKEKRPPSLPTQCAGTSWAAQHRLSQHSTSCLISSHKRPSSNCYCYHELVPRQERQKLHLSALFLPGGGRTTHEHGQQRESNLCPERRGR